MNAAALVFYLIVFLALYEGARVIAAFRKGEKRTVLAKDFIAAAAIGFLVIAILYGWHEWQIISLNAK